MKKKVAKELRKVAAEMPVIMRNTHEKHLIPGHEMIAQGITDVPNPRANEVGQPEKIPVRPELMYISPMPVSIAINHHRKLKKMYKTKGVAGTHSYVDAVIRYQAQDQNK